MLSTSPTVDRPVRAARFEASRKRGPGHETALPQEPVGSGVISARHTGPDRHVPDRSQASSGSSSAAPIPLVRPVRATGVRPSALARSRSKIAWARTIWWIGRFGWGPVVDGPAADVGSGLWDNRAVSARLDLGPNSPSRTFHSRDSTR